MKKLPHVASPNLRSRFSPPFCRIRGVANFKALLGFRTFLKNQRSFAWRTQFKLGLRKKLRQSASSLLYKDKKGEPLLMLMLVYFQNHHSHHMLFACGTSYYYLPQLLFRNIRYSCRKRWFKTCSTFALY